MTYFCPAKDFLFVCFLCKSIKITNLNSQVAKQKVTYNIQLGIMENKS